MTLHKRFDSAPDPHLIPESLRPLVAEVTDLRTRHNRAAATVADLSSKQHDHRAGNLDREQIGAEVRAGKTPKSLTPNADKLQADRTAAAIEKARLEAARQSVNTEVSHWLEDHGRELVDYAAEQQERAAEAFREAVAALVVARREYHVAREAYRWAEAATDSATSQVSWSGAHVLAQLDATPLVALRKEAEGSKRHRSTFAGFDA